MGMDRAACLTRSARSAALFGGWTRAAMPLPAAKALSAYEAGQMSEVNEVGDE
jgi:hypothetical protein